MKKEQNLENSTEQALTTPVVMRPSFWFMRDNHTFYKPKGKNLDEVKKVSSGTRLVRASSHVHWMK